MMKTGKNNRFLASILAASMLLAMSPFAFAAADTAEQKEMTTQEQVQPATQNETNANPTVSQTEDQSSKDTNSEALKTKGQSSENTNSEASKTEGQPSEDVKPAGDSTSASKTPAESENPTESETPAEPETPKSAAKIGESEYASIADALAAAQPGDTIELLKDVTENITINKSLTLDLGKFTLSGNANAAVVTISGDKSQVIVQNGTVTGGKKSGIRITDADVTLTKLTVTKNASTGDGGGIDAVKGKELVVEQCAINENTAKNRGGGILVEDTPLKVVGSKIENNQGFHGAGIYLSDPKTPVCGRHEITGTLIEGNKVLNDYGIGGGIHVGTRSQVNIENSTISKNAADQGGGIVAYTADSVILNHVVITENQATVGAGILTLTIHACNTEFKLTNNTEVKNNTATYYGGGVMAWGDGSDGIAQVVTVENSSISNNNAKDGAGIFINLQDTATNAFVTINLGVGAIVQENKATRNGGGIFARNLGNTAVSKGTINAAEGSAVYNNTAAAAGDDLYLNNGSIFTLPNAKAMSGDRILSFDNMEITGWYHDGWNKWNAAANEGQGGYEPIGRWTAETADEYIPVEKDWHAISLKAAHPLMYTLTYDVTGDLPEGYTAPAKQTLVKGSSYTVAEVPASVSGSKDGVNGTFSFNGWKKDDGTVLTGEQQLTADLTLHGVWSFTKKSSGGGGGGSHKPTVTIPDDVPTGLNGDDHFAYIVGYPNGNVEPNGNITRAEVATIFFRLLTEEVRTANSTQSNSLSDVTRGQWFNHAVSTLSSMGIVKGHNDGTFAPNAPITRAEFAAIAARFDDKNTDTSSKFTDIASHWAKNEIGIAANKGWINGYPDDTFRPNQYITRAEAMTLVNRVLNRLPENSSDLLDSMIKWPDNSDASAWYYLAVQEATNSHAYSDKSKDDKYEKWTTIRETRDWTELEK
ncbi:MAG: S-layer homology domain-containing protein [Agathobaculum butyriciproducens]